MIIAESPLDLQQRHTYFCLSRFVDDTPIYLKLEGLNQAGSIKMKTAVNMIEDLEERGRIDPMYSHIIESSSGNLGIALSIVCKVKGYPFTCVTDPNTAPYCETQMRLYGAKVIRVTERDENGGFLNTRIKLIKRMVGEDPSLTWTNQYANDANPNAHERFTAHEIASDFPGLGTLFVGAGTTGTLRGCVRYFAPYTRRPTIVAVDVAGSVTFGSPPGKRYIPGLGTSRRPEIFNPEGIDRVFMIPEAETVKMAREILERYGILVGASTATALCGVAEYARAEELVGPVVVISPDFGDKYVDTVFSDDWASERFPELGLRARPPALEPPRAIRSTWSADATGGSDALSK